MTFRYLDKDGAISFWTNIKNYILSKIPTKTSELTNDSGFLTQHQSLSNYVTLNSSQTIAGMKTITGGNQGKMIFKNPNFTVGTTPESTTTVTRIYFGGGASYDGSTGVITNDISSNGYSQLEICALNNNSSSSNRASLILRYEQDQTRPRLIKSWGDFCPYYDNTYYLGRSDSVWKACYSNAYYLGTTAFGDIVTHNASEFSVSGHTHSASDITSGLATVATSGSYNDLSNKPTIPTVNNATLTIQKNGTTVKTFTANASSNVTANITVPTKVSELTNDSGYLTSHQSLANYLTKTTNVSEMGRYIDLHYDNATSKYDYDARLYVDSQGTAAGGGSFKIAAASAYAPAPASNANDTRIATTAWVNSKGYLTSHPSITLSSNTTSTASPAHGGTFTCIDSVTQDTNGHITKVNTKTVTLPSDNNTDTKVTQTVTTANSGYPVLLCATANATTTETTTSRFSAGLTVNTRYSSITMTNKYDTANTKGVRNTSSYSNGILYFRCYDASEMGTIRCESNKNGYQQTYMQAKSYIKNGAISPEGTATTCYITVRVRDNGSKTIYTDGSWENSLTPYANNTYSLGTSNLQWKNAYIKNLNLNGNAFDPTSIDGVGTVKLLAYLPTSSQEYTMNAGTIKAGSNLGEVWAFHTSDSVAYLNSNMSTTQSGTWKLLNFVSVGGNPVGCKVIGLWVRIA